MFLHFGQNLYGTVDVVPGLFSVQTRFVHVNLVPLVPTQSYLIAYGPEPVAVPIPLSNKSVAITWFRVIVGIAIAVSLIASMWLFELRWQAHGQVSAEQTEWLFIAGGTLALSVLALRLSYRLAHASPQRAFELGRLAGIPAEVVAQHIPDGEHWLAMVGDWQQEPF